MSAEETVPGSALPEAEPRRCSSPKETGAEVRVEQEVGWGGPLASSPCPYPDAWEPGSRHSGISMETAVQDQVGLRREKWPVPGVKWG